METCPKCGRNFPDGALMNVFVSRGGEFTQQLLCKQCGLEAGRELHGLEIKPKESGSPLVGCLIVLALIAVGLIAYWFFVR
jgi:hypothetical protein